MQNCKYPGWETHTNGPVPKWSDPYHPGFIINYTCVIGYSSDNLVKICSTNGEWIGEINCKVIKQDEIVCHGLEVKQYSGLFVELPSLYHKGQKHAYYKMLKCQ